MRKRVLVCFGTRPEVIKLAPVIFALRNQPEYFECVVCSTGQHREMVDQALQAFGLSPDIQLDAMSKAGSLGLLTATLFKDLDKVFSNIQPHIVVVQGDTTSAFAGAMTAFYQRSQIAHVEAGLRTHNISSPFPEEINRVLISRIANFNFAPTQRSADNLAKEHIAAERIHITGNTVVDALHFLKDKVTKSIPPGTEAGLSQFLNDYKTILVTSHRRENFGEGLANICEALLQIVRKLPDVGIIFPVHLNPNVRQAVHEILGNHPRIRLIEPVDYLTMLFLMERSYCILSDSGGIQEEAPSLGKPLLILRENTERPECIEAGCALLVGTDVSKITNYTYRLLTDSSFYRSMSIVQNPFGDGKASEKITKILSSSSFDK